MVNLILFGEAKETNSSGKFGKIMCERNKLLIRIIVLKRKGDFAFIIWAHLCTKKRTRTFSKISCLNFSENI